MANIFLEGLTTEQFTSLLRETVRDEIGRLRPHTTDTQAEYRHCARRGGHEFKNVQTYNLNRYPAALVAPQAADYKKPEESTKAQARFDREQKTVLRRDYLHSHLTDGVITTASAKRSMMLAFAKHHLPEQTAIIEKAYKEEYAKKNTRLDERIAELTKRMKPAKAEPKTTEKEQATKPVGTDSKATATALIPTPTKTNGNGAEQTKIAPPPPAGTAQMVIVPKAITALTA